MKKLLLILFLTFIGLGAVNAQPWTLYQTGVPYSLFAVDFKDANTGIAVGQGGTIIRTTDGGQSWNLVYQHLTIWLNDVKWQGAGNPTWAWAVGLNGVILKSTNDGANWTVSKDSTDVLHTLRGLETWGVDNMIAVGYAGAMFQTNNGGADWVQRTDIPWTMHAIAFSPNFAVDGRAVISGTDGLLWRSTNSGATWIRVNSNRYDYLNDVVFITDQIAMICGNNGTILRSTNAGATWAVNLQNLTSEHLRSIDMFTEGSDTKITTCGDHGKILTSNDVGFSFVEQLNLESRHMYGVSLRSLLEGTAVGEIGSGAAGAMYVTMTNGTVGISQIGNTVPDKFELKQNYPNPFNPSTKINFSMPFAAQVKLSVYDMSGKEVASLVNAKLGVGNYEYEFNASNLASGVYFYKLITNDFIQTKKMTLIK